MKIKKIVASKKVRFNEIHMIVVIYCNRVRHGATTFSTTTFGLTTLCIMSLGLMILCITMLKYMTSA
jgi:hypothetical protein